MASSSYFGRAEGDGRRLGADFDLLAKWTRAFSMGNPVHSYYLTQLSETDRAQLFTGPAKDFQLHEGPDNTVKLETLQDEMDRIEPDVRDMIQSTNYQRSEARQNEVRLKIDDSHDAAHVVALAANADALRQGLHPSDAGQIAREAGRAFLVAEGQKIVARWKAERNERLSTGDGLGPEPALIPPEPIQSITEFISQWNFDNDEIMATCATATAPAPTLQVRRPAQVARPTQSARSPPVAQSAPIACPTETARPTPIERPAPIARPAEVSDSKPVSQPALGAIKSTSPSLSVPGYASETSSGSPNWSSPQVSAGETPSSPDMDVESVMEFDEADGGVALLPSSLVEELGLKDVPNVISLTPTPRSGDPSKNANFEGLGAGLSQAMSALPVNTDAPKGRYLPMFGHLPPVDPAVARAEHNALISTKISPSPSTSPFSPNSKAHNYPVAKTQPWMGFTCYEVAANFGNDRLVPKYWTTKRGKERYIRHKIGELKLDDAKLRSDRFSGSVARNPIHIFIDLSNIIIGFYDSMKESRGMPVNKRVIAPLFSFKNFDTILTRDRNVSKRIVAGSMTNSFNKRWPGYMVQAQELKYEMNILERVPKPASPMRKRRARPGARDLDAPTSGADTSGEEYVGPLKHGEQGVDELLHLKILQSAMDSAKPATMVLATGDAASAQYSDGFKKNVERVLGLGWNIELYGWSRNISSSWRDPEFIDQWGHQFKIVELDGFCEELFDMTVESLEE
ncbi:hypothetical protein C8A05DRAFT_14869 [Staphylotrichum tortipilum]|uniref:NYN domain-containing protein n=1 Tax=Staphylotrichum tortipilum TaxID=2831512 RepID=A0AAN6RTT0_9PEZI|nr:hypothetical protein C8A05DRAFT_14869 [Staphylotrichum longicolle]